MARDSDSRANAPRPLRPLLAGAVVWAGALVIAAFGLTVACAQTHAEASAARSASSSASSAAALAAASKSSTKPSWTELTTAQQQALEPLGPHWETLNVGQKRKWLALSRNYATMSADDQNTLRSRMIEWAGLSNLQRAQARLTFAEVKRVPPDERKAKWEQYLALSEEEKRKLAERAPAKPRGVAIPVKPVAAQKLVPVPAVTPPGQHTPRILLAPPATTVLVASPLEKASSTTTSSATPAATASPASLTSSGQPVPAEAQVPAPSATTPAVSVTTSPASAGRATEQPSSVP